MGRLLARLLTVVAVAIVPAPAVQGSPGSQARQALAPARQIAEGAEEMLADVSHMPTIQDTSGSHFILSPGEATEPYGTVTVMGLEGHPLCASVVDDNLAEPHYFRSAVETGGFASGDYAVGRLSRQSVIHFARPFKARDGTVARAVATNLTWFGEQVKLPLPPDPIATVADRGATTLARDPDGALFVAEKLPTGIIPLLEALAPAVTMTDAIEGRDLAYTPPDAALGPLAQANRIGITLILAGASSALALGALLGARMIRRPLGRLRVATEAVRPGVRDFDLVTGVVTGTPEAERILGGAFVDGATIEATLAHIHPDDRPSVRSTMQRALSAPGNDCEIDCRIRDGNGGWRRISACGHVVFEAGTAKQAIAVVKDKQVAADLAETTALIRGIGDSSVDAIYAKDLEGRFLYANPALLAIIGKSADAVIGHTDAELHADPERAAAVMTADRRIIRTGNAEIVEETFDSADLGKRVFRSAKSALRLENGTVIGIAAVSSDITSLKEAEAGLRRMSAELEAHLRQEVAAREAAQMRAAHAERMQALGQLAGGIAHDFNNVLQAVSGAMALIERRSDDAAGIRRLARLAGEAAERGAAITRRLLGFARRGDLQAEAIEAEQLLPDLREILAHTLGAGIDVQVRVEPGLRPFVADKSQLETCVINLATNARDAMPGGGRLTMSATSEVVLCKIPGQTDGLDPGSYVRLSFEDTGTGMDAATLAHSIEPFFTTKAPGAGCGLGLSMAKGFAEQSGGGLGIESTPGLGTTVVLWLPKAKAGSAAENRPATPGAAEPADSFVEPQAFRVLLVDDEMPVREVLTMQLEDFGFTVLQAADGSEALALLAEEEAVDILVTDLSMPGMDGLALIRAVRERWPGLPAVLLTGYAGDDDAGVPGGAASGSFTLLRKPVTAAVLVGRLHSLLAARPDRDGAAPSRDPPPRACRAA